MNFTTEPPTTPGFYAWRFALGCPLKLREIAAACEGYLDSATLEWANLIGGEWCHLVPAEEVENAYREASSYFNGAKSDCSSQRAWQDSRAKQVAEGKQ